MNAQFLGTGEMWRTDPSRNPALWKRTDDHRVLDLNARAHDLSQKILNKGRAADAEQRVRFLESFLNNPNPNLFAAPRDDRERQLQDYIQSDINAGQRGLSAQDKMVRFNRSLADDALNRSLRVRNQRLQELDRLTDLEHRQAQTELASERLKLQEERSAQQMQRDRLAEKRREEKEDFDQALDAILEGADLDKIWRAFPRLNPAQRERLQALAEAEFLLKQKEYEPAERAAANANINAIELERRVLETARKTAPGWFSRFRNAATFGLLGEGPEEHQAKVDSALESARERAIAEQLANKKTGPLLTFDHVSDRFVPALPEPRPPTAAAPRLPESRNRLPRVRSREEAMRLPPGSVFIAPDGTIMRRR